MNTKPKTEQANPEEIEATAAQPESSSPQVTNSDTPNQQQPDWTQQPEYQELLKLREADKARKEAELTETERLNSKLAELEATAAQAQREALIAKLQVPDELVDLIPTDLESAKQFLGSDRFKKLKQQLSNQQPQPPQNGVEGKETSSKSKETPKAKSFSEIDFSAVGQRMLGN